MVCLDIDLIWYITTHTKIYILSSDDSSASLRAAAGGVGHTRLPILLRTICTRPWLQTPAWSFSICSAFYHHSLIPLHLHSISTLSGLHRKLIPFHPWLDIVHSAVSVIVHLLYHPSSVCYTRATHFPIYPSSMRTSKWLASLSATANHATSLLG